jgi:hypothetical protein
VERDAVSMALEGEAKVSCLIVYCKEVEEYVEELDEVC